MKNIMSMSTATFSKRSLEKLMLIAKTAAHLIIERHPYVLGVYLAGSMARGYATPSSDLDLCAVISESAISERQPPIILYGRPIFYRLRPVQLYSDIEGLLTGSIVLSAQLVDAKILYDPQGVVGRVQRAVLARYHDPRYLKSRVVLSLMEADRFAHYARLSLNQGKCIEVPSQLVQGVVYGLAPALFFLVDETPTERRCLSALKPVCEALSAVSIYDEIIGFLGLEEASNLWAEKAMSTIGEIGDKARTVLKSHSPWFYRTNSDWLSGAMADYFLSGARELLDDGEKEASIYCSMVYTSRILYALREAEGSLPFKLLFAMEQLGSRVFGGEAGYKQTAFKHLTEATSVIRRAWGIAKLKLKKGADLRGTIS